MNIGGIQKSLSNLLCELEKSRADRYETELLLFYKHGDLLCELPRGIKIYEGNFFTQILGMTNAEAKRSGAAVYINRSFWTVMTRIFKIGFVFGILSRMQKLKTHYDCAVSFMQNGAESVFYGGCAEFVLNCVSADKKMCFVHCDFESYGGNCEYNRKILARFDLVAAVSESVAEKLRKTVPEIADKVVCVRNCCNAEAIRALSCEYIAPHTEGKANLFTAARLHSEKGILRMLPIFDKLKKDGLDFVWRIAGEGPDRGEAERLISTYGLGKNVLLLGNLKNPYPFFKSADAVLVPSYNEAAPMVFDEARILGTPIVTTDTTSAAEMVGRKGCGIVCANADADIAACLERFIRGLAAHEKNDAADFDNTAALSEFDALIG